MLNFKTNNLDLTAYLVTLGHELKKAHYIHDSMGEFVFKGRGQVRADAQQFFMGEVHVNLHQYLANRFMIKHQLKGQRILNNKKTVKKEEKEETAENEKNYQELYRTTYYYKNKLTGDYEHATFGKQAIHRERLEAGNFYKDNKGRPFANLENVL